MIAELFERLRKKDRRAFARLVSLAGRGESLDEIQSMCGVVPKKNVRVIAITGSAGVGKSTLLGRLIAAVRERRQAVAVFACDPQSPRTGGALLGDVIRMAGGVDDGIYLRSLATPGGTGGVAAHLDVMICLAAAFGFDVVFIETVGTGQGDVAVRELADTVVLVTQPHAGDDVQWEKAGIVEIADVIVIHKADLPGSETTAAQLRRALDVPGQAMVPVVLVSSVTGAGVRELVNLFMASIRLRH